MRKEVQFGYYTTDEQGRFHSYNDEPAIVIATHYESQESSEELVEVEGYKAWYKEGKLHREGAPAVIRDSGKKFWYENENLIKEE